MQTAGKPFLSMLIIIFFSAALYANTLGNGFVYDDEVTIIENPKIKELGNLPALLTKDYFAVSGEITYRPVVTFTYFMEYNIFGLDPFGFHLTNILLHAANGTLLYIFMTLFVPQAKGCDPPVPGFSDLPGNGRTALFPNRPLITSLIFVAHPVLTEAVNAVSFREDLLVFLFYIPAFTLYLLLRSSTDRPGARTIYALSCILYFLALLSKETALTFLLVVYCHEWIYNRSLPAISVRYGIGYIAVTVIYIYLRFFYFYNPPERDILAPGLAERLMTVPWLISSYIKLAMLTVSLSADYAVPAVRSLLSPSFIAPLSVITAASLILRKLEKDMAFGVLFFFISLVPVYNIIPISNPLAERFMYLSGLGMSLFAGTLFCKASAALSSRDERMSAYLFILFIAVLTLYSLIVVNRNGIWRDNQSLWSDTVGKMPNSWRAHNNLGNVYYGQNRLDEAVAEHMTALKLKPDYVDARNNLGAAYFSKGLIDKAIEEYAEVLNMSPDHNLAHSNLGLAYARQGRYEEAAKEYQAALKLKPDDARVHYNLGGLYHARERFEEAEKEYKAATGLNPDNGDYHNKLGVIYARQERHEEAIMQFLESIRLRPEHPDAYANLGLVYINAGRPEEAVRQFKTALQHNPGESNYYSGLGQAYFSLGRLEESVRQFETALRLNPEFVEAHFNLGIALLGKGAREAARKEFETTLRLKPDHDQARQALRTL